MRIVIILMGVLIACSDKPSMVKDKPIMPTKEIDILENDKKVATLEYNQENLLNKEVIYNTETKKVESELGYIYDKKKLVDINVKGIDLDYLKYALDNIYQSKFLSKKGIKFEYPEIVSSEINDVSTILTVGKNYDDFKKDSVINGNEKTIIYKDFNKKIRFYPSYITQFISEDEKIKDYNLIIKDSLPIKEVFQLDNKHNLTREYFYKKNKVIKIKYTTSNSAIPLLQKEFIYKNL
ncbi:conserved hypothetical protein [Chryseobacterium sp. 8AT]|nr:conserved hypothetical protein [Chryseobacterium sp. 8AT]